MIAISILIAIYILIAQCATPLPDHDGVPDRDCVRDHDPFLDRDLYPDLYRVRIKNIYKFSQVIEFKWSTTRPVTGSIRHHLTGFSSHELIGGCGEKEVTWEVAWDIPDEKPVGHEETEDMRDQHTVTHGLDVCYLQLDLFKLQC